jgi:ATP phosphoribosyltransferase
MIRLGIPSKGRLQEKSFQVFRTVGINISKSGSERTYQTDVAGANNIEVRLLQASEIPAQLESGVLHLGITGQDLVEEQIPNWHETIAVARKLDFGFADMVVAVANCWIDVTSMADLDDVAMEFQQTYNRPLRVATKYHAITRNFFGQYSIRNYRIIDSQGATEGTIASQTADVIVDITSSGDTLRANNLKVLDDGIIMKSQACLFQSLTAQWSPQDHETLQNLQDQFKMYDLGQQYSLVSAYFRQVPDIVQATFGIEEQNGWIAIRIRTKDLAETLQLLKDNGAEHIDVSDISMMYQGISLPDIDVL